MCADKVIYYNGFDHFLMSCDRILGGIYTPIDTASISTVADCIDACRQSDDCYKPFVSAAGQCNLLQKRPAGMPVWSHSDWGESKGWAALEQIGGGSISFAQSTAPLSFSSTVQGETGGATSTASPELSTNSTASMGSCDLDPVSYCPRCDGFEVRWGQFGNWVVYCGRLFTNATYFTDPQQLTVRECVDACMESDTCDSPVVTPDGQCLLAQLGRDENGERHESYIEEPGWAILLPRFTGGLPIFGEGSTIASAPTSSSTSVLGFERVSGFPPQCQLSSYTSKCPQCNGAFIEDSLGFVYQLLCSSIWVNRGNTKLLDFDLGRCMVQCENTPGCHGFSIDSDNRCGLAFGAKASIQKASPSHTALVLNPSKARTPKPARSCTAQSISCPACANSYVKDDLGKVYHVLCNSAIWSERFQSVERSLTAAGCMAECDKFVWCEGVNYERGVCKLARGENAFPQRMLGTTALLPVDLSYTPSPPKLSAFPTGEYSPIHSTTRRTASSRSSAAKSSSTRGSSVKGISLSRSSVARASSRSLCTRASSTKPVSAKSSTTKPLITSAKSATGQSTSTKTSGITPTASPCSLNNVKCRQCDRTLIYNSRKNTYRVQCNFQPICNGLMGHGDTSQDGCMQYCDADATCLAAVWNNGHCNLCQGSLEGLATYESPQGYVVFVKEAHTQPP